VGFGHVGRCLALAAALAPAADCRLLLDAEGPAMTVVRGRRLPCEKIGNDLGALLAAVEAMRADALVVDSYTLNVTALRPLRDRLRLLVLVDDTGEFPLPAHLVVNPTPSVRPPATGRDGYLLGTEFALLAREFAQAPARDWFMEPARVLLTLGATTPAGLMGALAGAARWALPEVAIDVVIGPAADQLLVNRALRAVGGTTLHVSPDDMRGLMLGADLAVSAGGVTLFELAATGMPTVGVALAANQRPNLIGLADAKGLLFAGGAEDPRLPAAVGQALHNLARDAHRRRTLGERARMLVDGQGAARVATALRARLAAAPAPVGARK
jgi:spore coat polysaccharide biosynthesis predicted glycosyltransferase SpsG